MMPKSDDRTGEGYRGFAAGRSKAVRYAVPVAVVGLAAATIGLVPALADSGDPNLPKITAQQLVAKMAASHTEQLSGSVKIATDLGIPSTAGLGDMAGGALAAPGGRSGDGNRGSAADPGSKLMELASGSHTVRVAADGPGKQRVSILDDAAEYSVIHNGDELWAYDSASNEAFHSMIPQGGTGNGRPPADETPVTPGEFADRVLELAGHTSTVSVDGTGQVAGRDAYQLLIEPKQSGSTVGSVKIAVDAQNGTPLSFTLRSSSGGKAVVDVAYTRVDFSAPAASAFSFTPPKGTKVTQGERPAPTGGQLPGGVRGGHAGAPGTEGPKTIGSGWTTVVELDRASGAAMHAPKQGELPPDASNFLNSLGERVTGSFGSGMVFKTRLVNALMTDDGRIYAGAVTQSALIKAADAAK